MRAYKSRSRQVLFLGGWLFTDLLLLLTILFFIGNVDVKPESPIPTPPLPRLELNYRSITLSIDPDGLLNNSLSAKNAVKQQIRRWQHGLLSTRRVGLAIANVGAPDTGQISTALTAAQKIYDLLDELGRQGFAFKHASHYHPIYLLGTDRTVAIIDIYLFAE